MKLMFRATILCLILINFLITTAYSQDVSFYCPCPDENYVPKTYQIPGIVEAEGFMEGGALVGYYNIPQDEDLTGKTALRVSDVEILCLLALDENYLCLEPEDIGDLVVESINVGYLNPYEWLRYSVEVLESGSYTVSYSVSKNADSTLTTFFLVLNSLIPVSETLCLDSADSDSKVGLWSEVFPDDTEISSYKSFYTKKALIPFSLEKGTVDIILCMDDEVEFVNINSLVFELQEPSDTLAPTALPTLAPTALPTLAPTSSPTPLPTPVPTLTPTSSPTPLPTPVPTLAPTSSPTPLPTPVPTLAPTSSPTPLPTPVPTLAPTSSPTPLPTPVPTLAPTSSPTPLPTPVPTHGTPTPTSFELYTAKFNSTFVNQSSWESSYLDKIFTDSIVAIVCAECSAEIDEIRESTYVLSRERKLQTNSGEYDSIEVLFQVQNSSKQSEAALIEASESGSLLKVMSESSPAGLITATYIVTVSISDAELETASDDDESKNLLPIIASASVFGILICACIVIGGFIHKVKMAKRIDDECSTRDLEVSGFERYDKPDLFEEGWRTAGVLVSNIPYISNVYAMCNEIVLQFSTTLEMNENCRKVINWTINMQKFLRKVQEFAEANPKAEIDIGTTDLKECLNLVTVLLESTKAYKENRLFDQFTASRKLQKLTDDIWSSLSKAIQRIELSVNVTSLELNLHIDENVSVLISAVDHLDVKMTVIGENLSRFEDKFDRIVDSSMRHKQPSNSSIIECDPGLTDNVYSKVSATLGQLEHSTAGYKILNKKPIGVGATAKVYMVEYDGKVRAAKVTELGNMSAEQLQKVYFKLARELYTLTLLKHERIVELCGTITTIERFSLILEYMPLGSLRGMLNNFKQWEKLSQYNRHGILCDVCEGVAFLHDRGMHHRDLKSDNVLITNDFRAKLSDFGLSRTINSVSMFSKTGANTGGTLRFLPPEYFIHRSDPIKNPGEKRDVYSYGMVTFEVLSGIFGPEKSMPYSNLSYVDIELSIVKGQHPILSDGWDDRRNVYCSSEHAMIMRKCLSLQPSDRPSFTDIMHILNIGKSCNKDTVAGCYG